MTELPKMVRFATRDDEDALEEFLAIAHQDNGIFPMVPRKVLEAVRTATRGKGSVIAIIDGVAPLKIAASVGLVLAQYWYTDAWHIEDLWNFVHPAARMTAGAGYARELLRVGKWYSEKMTEQLQHLQPSVPFIPGVMTRKRLEGKIRLYRRELPMVGAVFAHGIVVPDRVDIALDPAPVLNEKGDFAHG